MDTRSRKIRPGNPWTAFIIGLSIVVFMLVMGYTIGIDEDFDAGFLHEYLLVDIKDTMDFQFTMSSHFIRLYQSGNEEDSLSLALDGEGENLLYYIYNSETGKMYTNTTQYESIWNDGKVSLPDDYNYYLAFDGASFTVEKDGVTFDVYGGNNYYWIRNQYGKGNQGTNQSDTSGVRAFLAVNKKIVRNPKGNSVLYGLQKQHRIVQWVLFGISILFLVGIMLIIFAVQKRKEKLIFDRKIAEILNRIGFEIKLLLLMSILIFFSALVWRWHFIYYMDLLQRSLLTAFAAMLLAWSIYLMVIDIKYNGKRVMTNNYINKLTHKYRAFERGFAFRKTMLVRTGIILAVEVVLMALFTYITEVYIDHNFQTLLLILILGLGITFVFWYLVKFIRMIWDMGTVIAHMEIVQSGDLATKMNLRPNSDLYAMSGLMNGIQEGMDKAVRKMMKSEQMKIELITNVSHDLKTPLTSIISYSDLLSKEPGLSDHGKEYIRILQQKSDRLEQLINDLFELSKASSGDVNLEKQTLDLGKLLEQTLADMQENIHQSQLAFRLSLCEDPAYILGDGKKLYRVFMNLFDNALKYAMEDTRVYIDLKVEKDTAIATIKNIANYEMNFRQEDVLERFVRGDKARTTEGSGLGLAIADSFVKLCGGALDIKLDGDLFKVMVSFPIVVPTNRLSLDHPTYQKEA